MPRPKKKRTADTVITSMRMSRDVMRAATKRAERSGLSRTQWVEQILRKELRMPVAPVIEQADDGLFG